MGRVSQAEARGHSGASAARQATVALIRVAGALHERNFWSQAVLDEIMDFLRRTF